ncbi:MAG: PEP-CTERM system TPR-repeat protein PrsT [Burkholderiales bacterium]|nr:PEP-CTERM system TPR-repeat protein PrsT [Burkholderiales bacterium]
MKPAGTRTLAALAAAVAFALAPATGLAQKADEKASKLYEDALVRYEKNDAAGAVIQLKNALRLDPRMVAGFLLLGKANLAKGDAAGAEEAFARALELGANRTEVAVPMAQAMLQLGKQEALLERQSADGLPPAEKVELLVIRGHAYRSLGDTKSAARAFEDARAIDPKNIPAAVAHADLMMQEGKSAEAAKLADQALAIAPTDPRVWNLKGSLAQATGDSNAALAAYSKALAGDARFSDALTEARLARLSLLLDLRRDAEAQSDVDYFAKENPDEPRALYLRAVYLSRKGDRIGAEDALRKLTRAVDPIPKEVLQRRAPQLLLLGGMGHYGLNQLQKARDYFEAALKADPRSIGTRKLLASILLTQGDTTGTINVLEPALKAAPNDPNALALMAAAYMGKRRYDTASGYLDRALKASGNAPSVEATLGLSLLGLGQRDIATAHLERAFKGDPTQGRAGFALALLHLKRGEAVKAAHVAEAVAKADPGNAAAQNLLGTARGAAGDMKGARAAYEQAAKIDKTFLPAQLNLARLDSTEGNAAAARARLEGILKAQPNNAAAMYELASAELRAGRRDDAVRWLEKLHAVNRRDARGGTLLVDLYIERGEAQKALDLAKDVNAAVPDNAEALGALGRAYIAVGNEKLAQATLAQMARVAAYDPAMLTEAARLQLQANDTRSASFSLEKALAASPDYAAAQVLAAEVDLASGETAKAEQRAKQIVARAPNDPAGYRLLGDAAMARKSFTEAATNYRTLLAKAPSTDGAIRLYRAIVMSGNTKQATESLETWLKAHPGDTIAMRALAESHLRAGNLVAARATYEQIVKAQGEDAAILNNLANILARQKDPKALDVAESAYKLAPNSPAVQDTLGWLLVEQGQLDKGLRHLRDARLRDPANPEIRYHLAVALAKAGRKEEARRELEPALADDAQFDGKAEARTLAKALDAR